MEENTIEIKLVGDQPGAGGGGKPSPPVGSSQDTGRVAGGRDLRENPDLDDLFAEPTFTPSQPAGGPTASERMRERQAAVQAKYEQEQRDAQAKREEETELQRRNRVLSGLATQRVKEEERQRRREEQEFREAKRRWDQLDREEERQKKREERELNAELKRQYREQQRQEKAEKDDAERRNRVLSGLANQRLKEEEKQRKEKEAADKKAERDAKDAEQQQRMKMIQAGQGAQQLLTSQGAGGKVGGFLNLAGSGFLGDKLAGFANSPAGGMVMAAGALIDTADGIIRQVGAKQREGIRTAGGIGKAVIANNYGEAADQATEALAGLAETVPIVGTMFAESLRTASAAANTFGELVRAAADRGRQLEGYSATIAGATSAADVRAMQRDIAEAQRNEQTFSRIIDAQSRIEDTQRAVFDPIKDAFLEVLADVVEPIADIAQDVKPLLKLTAQGVAFFIKFEAALATMPLKTVAMIIDWVANTFIPDWMKEEDVPNLLDELDRTVENIRNGQAERRPPAKDTDATNKKKKPRFFGGR